jgi:hypothetical protein
VEYVVGIIYTITERCELLHFPTTSADIITVPGANAVLCDLAHNLRAQFGRVVDAIETKSVSVCCEYKALTYVFVRCTLISCVRTTTIFF